MANIQKIFKFQTILYFYFMQQDIFSQTREAQLENLLKKTHQQLIQNLPNNITEECELAVLLREVESIVDVDLRLYVIPF